MNSFTLVIFGITSNLSQKYLLPALYDLEEKGLLPDSVQIIGVARSPQPEGWIQNHFHQALHKDNLHHQHQIKEDVKTALFKKLRYLDGHLDNPEFYLTLKKQLSALNSKNIIFYLAISPELYSHVFENLQGAKLNRLDTGWVRLMIEKPFGQNLQSAKQLNKTLHAYFRESQIYRLDHYLGKAALRNILKFRFEDPNFEHLMSNQFIDHIQITATESFGVGDRGGYYDSVGALIDVGQNHLLQMLTAAVMDKPKTFSEQSIIKERIKILTKLIPLPDQIIFGQYQGYRDEKNVQPNSTTDTFFSLKTYIDTKRFKNVPIYFRAGKKLAHTLTEVAIIFKDNIKPHKLIYRIQPDLGIFIDSKHQVLDKSNFDPYENLILDAINGDQTYFNSAKEVEAQWAFIDPLISVWGKPLTYQPGSWGPEAVIDLIETDDRSWINS